MSIYKAEPVVIPNDLAERFDETTGKEKGYLRNLIADAGNLHQLDEELLSIGLMSMVKGFMEDKNLPDDVKPLSIERLSNIVYMIMFAYCTGAIRVDEDGDVMVGNTWEDARKALDVSLSKKIKFANGKTMPIPEFMTKLRAISSPTSMKEIYGKVVTRQGLTRGIAPQSAFKVALVSIMAAKELIEKAK